MSDPSELALLAKLVDEVAGLRADLAAARRIPDPPALPVIEPEGLIDVRAAAAHCRVSPTTIYRASERGELRPMRAGARVRFTRADLDAWLRGERPEPGRVLPLRKGG
jgi:excisionase family DNA binding protein